MRRRHVALFSHLKTHFRNDPYRHITCGCDAENMMVCPACGDGACFRVTEKAEEEQNDESVVEAAVESVSFSRRSSTDYTVSRNLSVEQRAATHYRALPSNENEK